eukprot:XP_011674167.1 PREDICTED: uncharacterized protein LOC593558 [Strongylocentrotus purpuratus]
MEYPSDDQNSPPANADYPETPQSPTLSGKPSFKKRTIPKHEAPKVKRRDGAVVSKDGWLQKKDSTGLGVWRKRWCVISDFCLFYYKGADEVNQAGTVMLPSYIIKPVEPRDKINKKFAFKCEHSNMRTYYFAAESDDLMHQWIDALNDASQVNLDRGYGDRDEMDWGGGQVRSPMSLQRNGDAPTNGNHPGQDSPNRATGPPKQRGWGNYEDIEFGSSPGGETSLKNGHGPDRSLLQQSSRESWEGSQPRSNHDTGSHSSHSQEERRSGQNSHLSPPRSPSLHSASSRDHSYVDEKAGDPNESYNYVDISEIKERKRQNQLDSQSSYNDDPRSGQQQRPPSRHHDDRGSLGSGHSGYRNGRDEMDGVFPLQDRPVEINVSMASDADPSWGQGPHGPRSNNPKRSESRRSNASQRSEPSHQRGLAPMEEVPVTRASNERLHSAPRREESSYQQSAPPRGREPPMHDRVPPQHGRMPPQHGRVPSDYERVPHGHVRSPSEYSRSPSEYSRSPSEYSRSPSEHRGPPGRGPQPQQQYGRVPSQHGRAPHEAGKAPHGRMPPPGHGRGPPRQGQAPPHQGRAPPHQRQDIVRAPSHPEQGRPRQGQGRGYPPQGGAPHHQERMPIQQSRAPQEHSRVPPNQGRPQSMRGRPPPQHDSRSPSRASTMPRDMERINPVQSPERGLDRDSVDAAPTRRAYSTSSTSLNRNDTLKRQELEKEDEVAPLQPLGARQAAAPKTGRYRMWQQKTQQFVDLSTGIRLRLSIAAGDLVGKSHEELVLFLIQLRRDKANLLSWLSMIDNELTLLKDPNSSRANSARLKPRSSESLRRSSPDLNEDDKEFYQEILTEREDITRELDISAPLINLVDNLVRMGSLYGGDNHMIAQEFYGDKVQKGLPYSPPKKLIEFSRRMEEEKLVHDLEEELRQLETAEDVELQEKLDQLYDLDKKLQEISARVSVLKDEKDKIENTLQRLDQQIIHDWDDKEMVAKIEEQQRQLERQLTRVRLQLAQGTKELEEITAENSRIEHEVALMKSGMEGVNNANTQKSADSVKEKLQMEREVNHVQSVMNGLERQRTSLANQMDTLRRTQSTGDNEQENGWNGFSLGSKGKVVHRKSSREALLSGPYVVTDLDTLKTMDISALHTMPSSPEMMNNSSTYADTNLDGYGDPKQSFSDPQQSFSDPKQSFRDPKQEYLDTKRGQLDSPMSQAISPGVYPAQKGQFNQGDPILGSADSFPRYNDSYDPASGDYYQGKGVPGEASLAGRGDQGGYDQRGFDQDQGGFDSEKFQGVGYDGDTSRRSDFDRSIGDAGGNDVNNRTIDSNISSGQSPYNIPAFDDVMGNEQSFGSPARVDSSLFDSKGDPEARVAEQGLVQAQFTSPAYSSPSFSATPPQGSVSGKGKGFWSTDLDTKEKRMYPEIGQAPFEVAQEKVTGRVEQPLMKQPLMDPIPHPYDMEESFEQKPAEDVQPPPLTSPEVNSDLTPVGLFHYTSLSPKSFDAQPTKKQFSKQSLDHAHNTLPDYATQPHDGYKSPLNVTSNSAPPSSQVGSAYQDGSYFDNAPLGNSIANAGESSNLEGSATLPYTSKRWEEYASQPQWDYGIQDDQAPPSESSYRSDDSKRPKERKTSLYGPTPFRKTSSIDPMSKTIPGFSSVSAVTRRRKPGLDEEKKNRRKSASERLLNSGSQSYSEPRRDAFSDTEMEPSPVMTIKPGKPISRLKRQTSASQRLIRSARAKSLPGNINLPSSDNGTGEDPSPSHQPLPAPVQTPSTSLPPQPPSPLRVDVFAGGQKKIHTLDGTITYKPSSVWEKALVNDLPMGDLQRALKTKDEEVEEEEQRRRNFNYVYQSDLKNVEFDESTGGGLLGIPAKVHIPERYNPAEEDNSEMEIETAEENEKREQKAKKMAKILSSQSMQEWHPREILPEWNGRGPSVDMKEHVEREKELRQEVLVKRRALAQEVSQQTKVLAD